MIAGNRAHGTLHAQVVLFSPLSTFDVAGWPDRTLSRLPRHLHQVLPATGNPARRLEVPRPLSLDG